MEELRNLKELAKQVVQNFNEKFDARDCKIPQAFKDSVKRLKSFSVVYNEYSVIIKGDGVRSKDSYVPNQSFFMASFFIEYSYELSRYKQKIMPWLSNAGIYTNDLTAFFTHERDKGKEDVKNGEDKFVEILDKIGYSGSDRNYLIKFVTDYDWWSGSKTIERSDFFNSPVLSIMGLTASSNAAMALIVDHLTQHPELSNLLLNQIGNVNMPNHVSNLQQIFYGAPGTGKSHKIKDDVAVKAADEKNLVFRTTFHPDSDYSTFVGAYKPTIAKKAVRNVAGDIVKNTEKEEVFEDCITYSFVPQAFLQAYVSAWNNPDDKVFLVIEEINRGNCAQIFGDLFQLLDRDENGWSEYPIMADKDLAKYLNGNDEEEQPVLTNKDGIKDGKLCLPKNLHIWATMNTSDQSLFPIDSAFKRRWDWQYMPIADAKKNYVIEIDNDQYDWWSFLTAINTIIESTTHSEDKKLGYFFAKAKDGIITAETFVGKIIFYLWNDVFKDNESNHKAFKDSDGEMLAFHRFFHEDGSVNTNVVIKFLQDLEVFPFEVPDDGTAAPSTTVPNAKRQRDNSRYSVNGTDGLNKAQMTREAFRLYIDAHPEADAQTIAQAWNGLGLKDYVRHLVETEDEFNARTKDSSDPNKRATEFELSNGEKIYLSTQFGIGNIGKFIDAVNNAGWNIRIDKQA